MRASALGSAMGRSFCLYLQLLKVQSEDRLAFKLHFVISVCFWPVSLVALGAPAQQLQGQGAWTLAACKYFAQSCHCPGASWAPLLGDAPSSESYKVWASTTISSFQKCFLITGVLAKQESDSYSFVFLLFFLLQKNLSVIIWWIENKFWVLEIFQKRKPMFSQGHF